MPDISNPHDKFFKESFSQVEIARDFLKNYLQPDVYALLNLDQISIQKDSFIDDAFKEHFSDLLFLVPLKSDSEVYVYTLFEHKSAPDSRVALQLLRYMVRIWERDEKKDLLRLIIPIVIYHGKQRWNVSTEFTALFPDIGELRGFLPNFHYLLYDLPRYAESEITGEYKLRMALWIMKYIFNPELLKEISKIISIYTESKRDRNADEFLKTVLLYMIAGSKVKHVDLEKELKSRLRSIGADNIMITLAEHYRQEGLQEGWHKGTEEGWKKGKEEGLQEGLQKGQVAAIKKILNSRFGTLPEEMIRMVEAIDNRDKLDRILSIAIEAKSIPDFMKNL